MLDMLAGWLVRYPQWIGSISRWSEGSFPVAGTRMAYPPTMEEMPGMGNSIEVTVQTMSGRRSSFFMDKFGLIGDVKQRLSKELLMSGFSRFSFFL